MFHNELVDDLITLASMHSYPGKIYIDPLEIQVMDQHCNIIEVEAYGEPWYHNIKHFIKSREYPLHADRDQKRTTCSVAFRFLGNDVISH